MYSFHLFIRLYPDIVRRNYISITSGGFDSLISFSLQVFLGNSDANSIVRRRLLYPIETRFLRIRMLSARSKQSDKKGCLKMDVYGCPRGKNSYIVCHAKSQPLMRQLFPTTWLKKKWKCFFAEATDPNKKTPIFGLIGPTELTAFNGTEITITGEQRVGSVTLVWSLKKRQAEISIANWIW